MKRKNTEKQKLAVLRAALLAGMLLAAGMTAQAEDIPPEDTQAEEIQTEEIHTEDIQTENTQTGDIQAGDIEAGKVLSELLTAGNSKTSNILLVGTDHRSDSWNGNSDVMILVTLCPEDQKVVMTSFMRDLYADIPGHGVHKLNYAFAVGGGKLLEETLEDNYEIEIDNYAVADFESMAELVDSVGGVEMEISDDECYWLNGYLNSMEAWDDYLPGGGTYVLNGDQAVAFMRIRFVGNNDYQRTQRQRDILRGMFEGLGNLDSEQLLELMNTVYEEVEHDFSLLTIMKLFSLVPELRDYELEESRIPYDDLYTSQNEMLVPDFEETIARLHEELGM